MSVTAFQVGNTVFAKVPVPIADASRLVRMSNHHVLVFDRSGSMYSTIQGLVEDMKNFILTRIPEKDTISIAWFSSEGGQHSFVLKNCPATASDRIVKGLDSLASVLGTTCFSEVLSEVPDVINDGMFMADTASLLFFTDGYPVVSNVQREMKGVYEAIARIAPHVGNAVVVGYGQYYNKKVLAEMASALGAVLVHASQLTNFYSYLDSGYALMGGAKKIQVHLPDGATPELVFTIDKETNAVAEIEFDADCNVSVPESVGTVWAIYQEDDCPGGMKSSRDEIGAVYAAAALLLANERTDEALQLMSDIGDVRIVQMVSSAWTLDDFAKANEWMRRAVFTSNARFSGGKRVGCLPDANAFCVLDALELLSSDENARMHRDKGFEYKRVGIPRKRKEGYPPFIDNEETVPLTSITFNETRMNVSLLATTHGSVDIGDNTVGLPRVYPCTKFNNYTFVKDGNLNVGSIWASTSEDTYNQLRSGGAVDESLSWSDGEPYLIDFTNLPMINAKYTSNECNASDVAGLRVNELMEMVRQKVLGYLIDQMEEEGYVSVEEGLTLEQQEYLKEKGISAKGAYQPPTEKGEATDYYFAKTFSLKVKGWSSIPKVSEVVERVAEGKKLNNVQATVQAFLDSEQAKLPVGGPERYAALLNELDKCRAQLRAIRRELQGIKFAVCLRPGKWFGGITRQDPTISYMGFDITFELGEEKVEY